MLGCLEAKIAFADRPIGGKVIFARLGCLLAPASRASDCSFDLSQILDWLCTPTWESLLKCNARKPHCVLRAIQAGGGK